MVTIRQLEPLTKFDKMWQSKPMCIEGALVWVCVCVCMCVCCVCVCVCVCACVCVCVCVNVCV